MDETSPAVQLRSGVVLLVVRAIVGLTFLLYLVIGYLVVRKIAVPGELWQAAGAGFGYLTATLVNTKHDATVDDPAPVQVVNQQDEPVPVEAAADLPVEDADVPDVVPDPTPRPRRR